MTAILPDLLAAQIGPARILLPRPGIEALRLLEVSMTFIVWILTKDLILKGLIMPTPLLPGIEDLRI